MRKIYLFFFVSLFFFLGCDKKVNSPKDLNLLLNDSLDIYLDMANKDELSILKRKSFNQKAYQIINGQKNDSLNRVYMFKIANRFYNMNESKLYKRVVSEVLRKSIEANDSVFIAKSYSYLGDYYSSQSLSDSSYLYFYKAEKIYSSISDKINLAKTILNKALLQFNESDFIGSEKAVISVLRIIKNEPNKEILYESYNLLGIIYNEFDEYERSIAFHNKALESIDDNLIPEIYQSKATSLNNLGYVYQSKKDYKSAKKYFTLALKQDDLSRDKPSLYAMLIDNLAYSRFKLNESKDLPMAFYDALNIRLKLNLLSGLFLNKIHLSEYYSFHKDSTKALQFAREALLSARKDKNFRNVLVALKQMGVVEPQNASRYSKEYIHINDSLQKAERKMGEKFSRIEYETDVIKSENTDLVVQNRNLFYVFSILILVGGFIFVFVNQRNKHNLLVFKAQQQLANAEIYNLMITQQKTIEENRIKEKQRVARELHDGVLGKMFGVRMNLDSLNTVQDALAIKTRLKYLAELKQIEQDIREISHDMNRENSELINNFVVILTNLIDQQRKAFKTKVVFSLDKNIDWANISNEIKINLYRIVQEALQNSNKYAIPSVITIEFSKEENPLRIRLVVADDGKGFNLKKAKKGIGLQNIEFRTKACQGKLEIKTKPGQGTLLTVEVPIEDNPIT